MQEVGGAVERIDDPAVGLVGALDRAPLLHQEAVAGPGLRQLPEHRLLGAVVGGGDEVAGPFTDTCSCSTSPKSRASPRPALRAAAIITFIRAEAGMLGLWAWQYGGWQKAHERAGARPACRCMRPSPAGR